MTSIIYLKPRRLNTNLNLFLLTALSLNLIFCVQVIILEHPVKRNINDVRLIYKV